MMAENLIYLALALFLPFLTLYGVKRWKLLQILGPVVMMYLFGLLLSPFASSLWAPRLLAEISLALGIPLFLFSCHFSSLKRETQLWLSFLLGVLAVLSSIGIAFFLLAPLPEDWQIAGMLVALFVGGTPNLAAVKEALSASSKTFLLIHTYDTILSMFYILFLSTLAKPLFSLLLPCSQGEKKETAAKFSPSSFSFSLSPLLFALWVALLSKGMSLLFPSWGNLVFMLSLTTFGLAIGFVKGKELGDASYPLAFYSILLFCFSVASLVDFKQLLSYTSLSLALFVTAGIFGSLFLHLFFSLPFRIDVDTTIVVSVALICSPPFVPPIVEALKNHKVLAPGLVAGIVGYALANYLAIGWAYCLKLFV